MSTSDLRRTASTHEKASTLVKKASLTHQGSTSSVWENIRDNDLNERATLETNCVGTYNSIAFQIPFLNLFWVYVNSGLNGSTPWVEYEGLLLVLSLVAALVLALVSAFHSSVTFEELNAVDTRFAVQTGNQYRQVDGYFYNGAYSSWWTDSGPGQLNKDITVVQEYNFLCVVTSYILCEALLVSVLVLAVTSSSSIAKPTVNSSSDQNRVVLRAYMKWVIWCIYIVIFCTIGGVMMFFQILKTVVYVKFPDEWVERESNSQPWPFSDQYSTYGYAGSSIIWLCYVPLLFGLLMISAGQRAAYAYPVKPVTLLSESKWQQELRESAKQSFVKFLVEVCHLPTDGGADKMVKPILSAVGGGSVNDAEVIADAIIDQGILTLSDLLTFMEHSEGALFDIPGVSVGAAAQVSWEFKFGNAKFVSAD